MEIIMIRARYNQFMDEWVVEVTTEHFGPVLLLDNSGLPIPICFQSKEIAQDYIEEYKFKNKRYLKLEE